MSEDVLICPSNVEIAVPHVEQIKNWDCGIACILMVLRYFLNESSTLEFFQAICKIQGIDESVWTIDLAYLLKYFKVKHLYCTVILGVDSRYQKEKFYSTCYDKDFDRVNDLFEKAEDRGVSVAKRSVTLIEIIQHLSNKLPVIVLVNSRLLKCLWCDSKCLHYMTSMLTCCVIGDYYGHFIVLCGYNIDEKTLLYHNPSYRESTGACCMSYDVFESSRHSYGTDEDIIFIYK